MGASAELSRLVFLGDANHLSHILHTMNWLTDLSNELGGVVGSPSMVGKKLFRQIRLFLVRVSQQVSNLLLINLEHT